MDAWVVRRNNAAEPELRLPVLEADVEVLAAGDQLHDLGREGRQAAFSKPIIPY